MDTLKRAQVIMLPTENKINGSIVKDIKEESKILHIKQKDYCEHEDFVAQHLYIISDDEIKEGDWCMSIDKNSKLHKPFQCISKQAFINPEFLNSIDAKDIKKIIATTDRSLKINTKWKVSGVFDDGLPQPSQQFIEKYIESYNKGEVITDVLVKYEDTSDCIEGEVVVCLLNGNEYSFKKDEHAQEIHIPKNRNMFK